MARGQYERTELTAARQRLTRTETRISKLLGLLAEAEQQKQELEQTIKELQEAESNAELTQ